MRRETLKQAAPAAPARVRRGYFECRYGQLHLHNAMPPGGGFEEGTALLCLHDCPGSGRLFTRFLALAGRDRSVYAPDLPGFGESDAPLAAPVLADYAAALGDFLDGMRLRRLDVLGVRIGALIGAELALARPSQVARLVMVAPAAAAPAERAGAELPREQRWALEAASQYPSRERLARITQKLLVLKTRDEGADGRLRGLPAAARVAELELPGRELLAAAPERLGEAVRDFLRG
ncbi:MAG TPA: alpha/beta fold hydrolase [Steroidobacteraceae bacterium]|jgi:pimeloyl-ACP methyl ester carboxylesterase|nr:alpha/beta fold hydrolase [Steroidobacteraceae bacterium]